MKINHIMIVWYKFVKIIIKYILHFTVFILIGLIPSLIRYSTIVYISP